MRLVRNFRRLLEQSLLARSVLSNVLLIVVSGVALLSLVLVLQKSALQTQLSLRARMLADFVSVQSEYPMLVGNRPELERIARQALSLEDVQLVMLADAQGEIQIEVHRPESGGHSFLESVEPVLAPSANAFADWEPRREARRTQGSVRLRMSAERQSHLFRETVFFMAGSAGLSLIFILGVQILQMQRLLKPLQSLIEFTRRVGQGDLSCRAAVGRTDEVGRLTMAFNQMVHKLSVITVSKQYVDDIIRSMNEALVVLNADSTIRTVNQAALRMLGYAESELIGQPVSRILGDPADPAPADPQRESAYRKRDGSAVPVLLSRGRIENEGGGLNGEVWLAQDITSRIQTEQELRRAKRAAEDASRAKSDFLSRTSHELRTPLNAILGFGELLATSPLSEPDRESVEQINKSGRHLLQLINEVLDIAGIESGRRTLSMEPLELAASAEEALALIEPMADSRKIRIENRISAGENRWVMADHQRMEQVLLNLLCNAVKYNREGGDVVLSSTERPNGRIRVAISDEGPGIPPEKLARLFLPFERLGAEQTTVEGSGLGLALSKTLVEAMDGEIGCETTPGQGSTFWFELNPAQAVSDPVASRGEAPHRTFSKAHANVDCTVLYVEDTLSNLRLMERILELRPRVRLISARCGRDGVGAAQAEAPDLILLDVHLPDMNGAEVLEILKSDPICRSIPVVVLSADATPTQIERLTAAGAKAYLTKPLNIEQLLTLLDEASHTKAAIHV